MPRRWRGSYPGGTSDARPQVRNPASWPIGRDPSNCAGPCSTGIVIRGKCKEPPCIEVWYRPCPVGAHGTEAMTYLWLRDALKSQTRELTNLGSPNPPAVLALHINSCMPAQSGVSISSFTASRDPSISYCVSGKWSARDKLDGTEFLGFPALLRLANCLGMRSRSLQSSEKTKYRVTVEGPISGPSADFGHPHRIDC